MIGLGSDKNTTEDNLQEEVIEELNGAVVLNGGVAAIPIADIGHIVFVIHIENPLESISPQTQDGVDSLVRIWFHAQGTLLAGCSAV